MRESQIPGSQPEKFFHTEINSEASVEQVRDVLLGELREKMQTDLFDEQLLRSLLLCLDSMRENLLNYGTVVGILGDVPGGHLIAGVFREVINDARGAFDLEPANLHFIDGRTEADAKAGAEAMATKSWHILLVSPFADSGENESRAYNAMGELANRNRINVVLTGAAEERGYGGRIGLASNSKLFMPFRQDTSSTGQHLRDVYSNLNAITSATERKDVREKMKADALKAAEGLREILFELAMREAEQV